MKKPIALIVEDEVFQRLDAAVLLEETGFEVIEAETAAKGLRVLHDRGQDIAVLFTDVRTPGLLDGAELANEAAHSWPHVRLIVTSAYQQRAGLPRNATFLPKPWRPVEILAHAGRAVR
jgi:DNA-binding NtrC family response regulator